MNQRKLIRLGNSSYAIALPKEWVDKSGLGKGDNVFITPNSNGELIVHPTLSKETADQEKVINIEGMSGSEIGLNIVSSYVGGSKLIRLIGNKGQLKIAKQKARTFLNLEPIEENEKEILLKDLLDIEDVGIENFIRRMDNNLKEMFSLLLEMIKGGRKIKEKSKEICEIDKDVTKFYFLIWRFMNLGIDNPGIQANLKVSPSLLINHFWVAYNLEQVGDEIKRVSRFLEKVKDKNQLKDILILLNEKYNNSMKSFFDDERLLAQSIISNNNFVVKKIEILSMNPGLEVIAEKIHQINESIFRNAKMVFYKF